MDIAVSNKVVARNGIGQFIAKCQQAAHNTVEELVNDGKNLSLGFAPVGHKPDPRTVTLQAGMFSRMTGATSGEWGNFARHAMPIEFGAGPHTITGRPSLGFFWEAAGRRWIPAEVFYHQPGMVDVINHPGNAAQPYLRPAYEIVMQRAMAVARKNYPG